MLAIVAVPAAPAAAADAPTVTAVSPDARPQGATVQVVTITGTGFLPGAKVSFGSSAGVPVASVTVDGPTSLRASIDVRGSATPGPRTVTVTNPDGLSASCASCFTVTARPTVTSVSPGSLSQGATAAALTVRGTGFAIGSTVSFGGGVTVTGLQRVSATELRATVSVGRTTAAGTRTVTVTNPDGGTGGCATCFQVAAGSSITVASVAPAQRAQGLTSQVLAITGSPGSFRAGATVSLGGGVTVASTSVVSGTELRATVSIGSGATVGPRDVRVTNTDGSSGTCTGCFEVTARPTVTSVSPAGVAQAGTATVTVVGTGFRPGITVDLGSGVTVDAASLVVVSPTQLRVDVSAGGSATVGKRTVTVETADGGRGTCSGCFSVTARPTMPVTSVTPSTRGQGAANQVVTVRGSGFTAGADVEFGSGVTTRSVTFVSASELRATITIGGSATVGTRSVRVTNPGGASGTCVDTCFTVTARPALTSVAPASVARGATNQVVIVNGTGLAAQASASFGAGVSVQSVTWSAATPNQLRVVISVSGNAKAAARTLTVTNADGGKGTCTGACTFAVQ